jgi:hypothetical protein
MCPTPTGRVHTRTATIFLPALFGLIVSLVTGHFDWLVLVGIYYIMGIFLDTAVYSWLFRFQPPWMTFVLAIAELGFLLVLAAIIGNVSDGGLEHTLPIYEAIIFYWCCWILAIPITKVVLLPLISVTYLESAGEIRRVEWSIPESQVPLPVLASGAEAKRGPGPVVREASGVHAKPLPQLPSPSGVHRLPPQPGQAPAG